MSYVQVLIGDSPLRMVESNRRYKFDLILNNARNYCYVRAEEGLGLTQRRDGLYRLTEDGVSLLSSLGSEVYFADCLLRHNEGELDLLNNLLRKVTRHEYLKMSPSSCLSDLHLGQLYLLRM